MNVGKSYYKPHRKDGISIGACKSSFFIWCWQVSYVYDSCIVRVSSFTCTLHVKHLQTIFHTVFLWLFSGKIFFRKIMKLLLSNVFIAFSYIFLAFSYICTAFSYIFIAFSYILLEGHDLRLQHFPSCRHAKHDQRMLSSTGYTPPEQKTWKFIGKYRMSYIFI